MLDEFYRLKSTLLFYSTKFFESICEIFSILGFQLFLKKGLQNFYDRRLFNNYDFTALLLTRMLLCWLTILRRLEKAKNDQVHHWNKKDKTSKKDSLKKYWNSAGFPASREFLSRSFSLSICVCTEYGPRRKFSKHAFKKD